MRKVARVAVVVVTKNPLILRAALAVLLLTAFASEAAILPEDRADALYHSYDGGGVTINGPAIQVRKKVGESFSFSGKYYIDSVSSASIDVVTRASPYTEERKETDASVEYLRDKTTMTLAATYSKENDYLAKSMHFNLSQEVFGGMTTVSMGYSRGWDEVGKRDSNFSENTDRQNYRLGVSQVLTKNMLVDVSAEVITDQGFLNNPYREVRYLVTPTTVDWQAEVYPHTHTSTALAVRAKYYLPYRAALSGEFRYYTDSWGVDANMFELGYTHPVKSGWTIDLRLRHYQQNKADFYSDLFPYVDAQNFLARDKELSTFSSNTFGIGVSYEFARGGLGMIDHGTLNLSYDRIQFNYDDFRVAMAGGTPGTEPLYSFQADVIQFYISLWY